MKRTRVLKIESLTGVDDTALDVLRIISKYMGEGNDVFVKYTIIAKELGLKNRDTVRKAVKRLLEKNYLEVKNGRFRIPGAMLVEEGIKGVGLC